MTTYKYYITGKINAQINGKELARKQTEHQLLIVIDTKEFGKILLIGQDENDLAVQFSEKDEMLYHEAVTHPALAQCEPKNVLIIGGGDGGVAREALKHNVEKITIVDIDQGVVEFSKEHFPQIGTTDPRVKTVIGDGKKYLEESKEKYDAIIIDLTDPHGPATQLFTKEFYQTIHEHLTENGAMSAQTSDPVFDPQVLGRVVSALKEIFPNVQAYSAFVPSYMVEESYVIASKKKIENIAKVLNERKIELKGYTPQQLQNMLEEQNYFVRKTLQQKWTPSTTKDPVTILD